MIFYDVATKELDTELFLQYNIADLNSGITLIVLFSQEKPTVKGNKHTHTTYTATERERESNRSSRSEVS